MSKYMLECLNRALGENSIYPSHIGKPVFNEGTVTVDTKVNNQIYFFKFFFGMDIDELKPEVEFVKFYISKNIPIAEYFEVNNNILFRFEFNSIKSAFYGTHYVGQTNTNIITPVLLNNTINFIGNLHLNALNYNLILKPKSKITDYQKLFELYVSNYLFFKKYGFDKEIEFFLKKSVVTTNKYPIHSDLRFENIVFKNSNVEFLIDFSDLRVSYFEDDIGRFFQYLLYAKDVCFNEIYELIKKYEKIMILGLKTNNLQSSIIYHLMYRFYFDIKSLSCNEFRNLLVLKTKKIVENVKKINSCERYCIK